LSNIKKKFPKITLQEKHTWAVYGEGKDPKSLYARSTYTQTNQGMTETLRTRMWW
jgi:hypothetical protein